VAAETLGEVLRRIGRRAGLEGVLTLTDGQLLERFAGGRDEPAFAALMVRHGPMVLGVCRRLLSDAGEAEDAFQAAFLVLARKAGAIQCRPLLGAWLYGVAYKVAARLRGQAWRRRAREKPADFDALPAAYGPDPSDYPAIHEEVQRLPDKYRAPVVLCYLEGKTHEEAAGLLHWPLGTVKGRLARARDLLRRRLVRRGVGLDADAWRTAMASVLAPAALVDATVRAASHFAAGHANACGLISGRSLALTEGVLRTMMLTNGKILAALVLTAALLIGTGSFFYGSAGAESGPARKTPANRDKPPAAANPKEDKEAIQGTWKVTAVETGGKDVSATDEFKPLAEAEWVVTADEITFELPGKPDQKAAYKIDASKKPKELDVTPSDGPANEKDKMMPAIYSLEGDVLKICAASPDDPTRPRELASKEGTKTLLITFKRVEAGKAKPADKPKDDKEAILGTWQVADFEFKGKGPDEATLKKIKGAKWVFTADQINVQTPGEKDEPASYTLNPSTTPKELDTTPQGGQAEQAIYSLEGDTLKICVPGPEGGPRPTRFAAEPNGKTVVVTLKREKPGQGK
jgi:RNA polymerase sigma-70 factor (ECF subfamily)